MLVKKRELLRVVFSSIADKNLRQKVNEEFWY